MGLTKPLPGLCTLENTANDTDIILGDFLLLPPSYESQCVEDLEEVLFFQKNICQRRKSFMHELFSLTPAFVELSNTLVFLVVFWFSAGLQCSLKVSRKIHALILPSGSNRRGQYHRPRYFRALGP